jgi:small subunit ribosomal protein S17
MADEETVDEATEIAEEAMEAEGSPVPAEEPAAEEPVADAPAAEEPVADAPAAEEPVADAPAAEEPVADAPAAEEPVADAPAAEEPVADAPAAEEPVADAPAAEESAAEEPIAEEPAAEEPAAEPAPAPAAAVVELVHPKERRRRARRHSTTPASPVRTPEERQAERDALRVKNAKARADRRRKVRAKRPATTATVAPAVVPDAAGRQKTRQGIVVSDKAAKTITVRIDTSRRHRRYQKIVRSSKTLHAHDENNDAHEGDLVLLIETRPLSATKRWRLAEVLERVR